MKKLIFVFTVAFSLISYSAKAQETFLKGDKVINLGIGLGSYIGYSGADFSTPPVSLSGEYCVKDGLINERASIGVGGYLAYTGSKVSLLDDYDYGWWYRYYVIGARGAFHYMVAPKFDAYAGVMLGYNIVSLSWYGDSNYKSDGNATSAAAYSTFVGARYLFTENIGVFAEVGYGIAAIELGLSLKF
jgi:hypothetical protein